MPSIATYIGFTVLNVAILYQFLLKDVIFNTYGYQRELQPLSDFPYKCRRITDPNLNACEDAWIDDKSRQLFLACSNALGRKAWNPNVHHLAAERRSQYDQIIAMSLDKAHANDPQSFDYRILDFSSYTNALGESQMNLVGMTGRTLPDGTINLYFINAQPTFDIDTQLPTDQLLTGANATIEAFSLPPDPSATTLTHLHTFYNPTNITTPNNVAIRPDSSIVITNDHGPHRSGLQHTLSPILGTGSIAHCIPPSPPETIAPCTLLATSDRHQFPNGLHISPNDNLLYVPSSVTGIISVYDSPSHYNNPSIFPPSTSSAAGAQPPIRDAATLDFLSDHLTKTSSIPLGMPLDNISEDADGNLLVPGFPKLAELQELLKQATPIDGRGAPTTIWKISRKTSAAAGGSKGWLEGEKKEWKVEKLLEDPDGSVLPAATTAVRDAKTGRVWVVGVVSPWIAVCEPL